MDSKRSIVIIDLASMDGRDSCQITWEGDEDLKLGSWLFGTASPWPQVQVKTGPQESLGAGGQQITSFLLFCRPERELVGFWGNLKSLLPYYTENIRKMYLIQRNFSILSYFFFHQIACWLLTFFPYLFPADIPLNILGEIYSHLFLHIFWLKFSPSPFE